MLFGSRPIGTNDPFYRPERDLAYLGKAVLLAVRDVITNGHWPGVLEQYDKLMGEESTYEERHAALEAANRLYTKYLSESCQVEGETPAGTMQRVGWYDLPEPAKMAWMAVVGFYFTCLMHSALRDEHKLGERPDFFQLAVAARVLDAKAIANGLTPLQESIASFRAAASQALQQGVHQRELESILREVTLTGN